MPYILTDSENKSIVQINSEGYYYLLPNNSTLYGTVATFDVKGNSLYPLNFLKVFYRKPLEDGGLTNVFSSLRTGFTDFHKSFSITFVGNQNNMRQIHIFNNGIPLYIGNNNKSGYKSFLTSTDDMKSSPYTFNLVNTARYSIPRYQSSSVKRGINYGIAVFGIIAIVFTIVYYSKKR